MARIVWVGLLLLVSITNAHAQEHLVARLEDQQFTNNDWAIIRYTQSGNVESWFAGQDAPAIGFPGSRIYTVTRFSFSSAPIVYDLSQLFATSYHPSIQGRIDYIDYEVWHRTDIGGHIANLIAFQNDSVYVASNEWADCSGLWRRIAFRVQPHHFVRLAGPGPSSIDLSESGTEVRFGYRNHVPASGIRDCSAQILPNGRFTTTGWSVNLVRGACVADFNGDGFVNFFDVSAFMTSFSQQNPDSDLAPPSGVWDFFDIAAFIAAYNAGC